MNTNDTDYDATLSFQQLSPSQILNAIDRVGYPTTGHLLALNSYENRVYQIGLENQPPIIAKFYRPQRWSDQAIQEEHNFSRSLAENELPVIAPLYSQQGQSLHYDKHFRFALYPHHQGRTPELDNPEQLQVIGQFIARIHAQGELQPFKHRLTFSIDHFIKKPAQYLLDKHYLPMELEPAYARLIDDLLIKVTAHFKAAGHYTQLRIHGDFHPSNILYQGNIPYIVDFDDTCMGPAVQDIWMYLSGDVDYQCARLANLLEGYTQFRDFNPNELYLIEALRTLRIIHYTSWLAKRSADPAFKLAFPWFYTPKYWDDHILTLKEQSSALDKPPLTWKQ